MDFAKHAVLVVGLVLCAAGIAQADDKPFDKLPACDFSDDFYLENGIVPEKLVDRLVGHDADPRSKVGESPHSDFNDTKILEITGGFDHKGHELYYTVNAKVMPASFTNNLAGAEAMALANSFRAFIFPKADADPLSPGPPNRRQDNVFDTRHGYFGCEPTWAVDLDLRELGWPQG